MITNIHLRNVKKFDDKGLQFGEGITVLTGDNGSGKSTILNCICWCLIDKQADKIANFGNVEKPDMESSISVEVGDLSITKRIIPSGRNKQIRLEIYKNGEEIRLNTLTDYKRFIIRELEVPPYLFLNGVFIGQNSDIDLLVRPASAKKFLIDLFDLSNYTSYEGVVKDQLKIMQGQIKQNSAQIEALTGTLNLVNDTEIRRLDREIKLLETTLREAQETLNEMRELTRAYTDQYKHAAVARVERDKLSTQLHSIREMLEDLPNPESGDTIKGLEEELAEIETLAEKVTTELAQTKATLVLVKKNIQDLTDLSECYVCHQHLDKKYRNTLVQKLHNEVSGLSLERDEGTETLTQIKALREQNRQLLVALKEQNRVREIEKALGVLPEVSEEDAYQDVQQTLQDQNNLVNGLEKNLEGKRQRLIALQSRKYHTEQVMSQIKTLHEQTETIGVDVDTYKILAQAYGKDGIPKRIIESHMAKLEADINANLHVLSEGQMQLEFVTWKGEREVFEIQILHRGWYKPYGSLSGGEKKRVKIAAMMGLSDFCESPIDFRMGDEIDSDLDSQGIAALKELLITKRDRYAQIILASHRYELIDICDHVINL